AASDWTAAHVQVRAHGEPAAASVRRTEGDVLEVRLDSPLRGLAPGQSIVVYAGTRVLGQATIELAGRGALGSAGGGARGLTARRACGRAGGPGVNGFLPQPVVHGAPGGADSP